MKLKDAWLLLSRAGTPRTFFNTIDDTEGEVISGSNDFRRNRCAVVVVGKERENLRKGANSLPEIAPPTRKRARVS